MNKDINYLRAFVREFISESLELENNKALKLKGNVSLVIDTPEYDKSPFAGNSAITELPDGKYHITLMSVQTIKPIRKALERIWDEIVRQLPRVPIPIFDKVPRLAIRDDCGKESWFLQVKNQNEFASFVDALANAIRERVGEFNVDEDRFFHATVANNCGGDPYKSIGDVTQADVKASDERKNV